MTLQIRFRAYNPDGTTLGILDEPPTWDVSLPVNQVSAANFSYPIAAKRSEWLANACEVALEVYNGSAWVEPANARYLRMVQTNDPTRDEADVVSYSMPGYAFNLDGIVVVPYADGGAAVNYDDEGKRKFLAATPGRILKSVLDEARTIDPAIRSGLQLGFTPTADSAGAPWARQLTIYYEPGLSLLTILDNLSSQGLVDWVMQGRQLKVYNADTALATRRDSVVVRGAEDEAPTKSTLEGLRHIVMLRGDDGLVWLQKNANADTPWGKSMTVLNQGGVRDEGTALSLIGSELSTGSKERTQYTRSISLDAATKLPLVDFFPGDYIKAAGRTPNLERFRVFQITLRSGRTATLTLNDRFEDSLIRMAKRQKGIANGASGDAGSGSQPTAPNVGKRKPIAPQGLVVSSAAYIDKAGNPQAVVNTSFDAQEMGTDGLPLTLRGVELWGWKTADDNPKLLTVGDADGSIAFSPLPIDEDWSFRVRSIGTNGIASAFSAAVSITLASDLTAPPKPSTPTAESKLGTVTIRWDGKASNGTAMPVDYERTDVYRGPLPGTLIGSIGLGAGADFIVVTGLPYNITNSFWLVAVDTSQNQSEKSDSVTIATKPLVDTDLIGRVIADANIKLGAVKAELIADGAVLQDKLADNAVSLAKLDMVARDAITDAQADATTANGRVTISASAPVAGDGVGRPVGALWYRRDGAGQVIGMWEWSGSAWNARTLTDAVISNLNAGTITTGFLDAARIAASSISVQKLLVSNFSNLVENGGFEYGDTAVPPGWASLSAISAVSTEMPRTGAKSLKIIANGSTAVVATQAGAFAVDGVGAAAESYRVGAWVHNASAVSAFNEIWLQVVWSTTTEGGSYNGNQRVTVYPSGIASGSWTYLEGVWKVPEAAKYARVRVVSVGAAGRVHYVDDITATKMSDASLIVDGAITTDKVFANAITTAKIATNAVTANEIAALTITANELAANAITTAKIAALAVDAGKIAANAITADKIEAGAITAVKIAANAIDATRLSATAITAKHTITGATLQTTTTANRGLKFTSNGLVAYDLAGAQTVSIDAATGNALFAGNMKTAPSGPRIEVVDYGDGASLRAYAKDSTEYASFYSREQSGGQRITSVVHWRDAGLKSFSRLNLRDTELNLLVTSATDEIHSRLILRNTGSFSLGSGSSDFSLWSDPASNSMSIRKDAGHSVYMNNAGYTHFNGVGVQVNGTLVVTGSKNFGMDHPTKPDKSLIHASTESPHNGVEYWSDGFEDMPASGVAVVDLPEYFEALTAADHRVAMLSAGSPNADLWAEPIEDGKLVVHGAPGAKFSWVVKARRIKLDENGIDSLHFDVEQEKLNASELNASEPAME